jgi:hypothetical protein
MLLNNFLDDIRIDGKSLFSNKEVIIIRHAMKNHKDGNWHDLDDRLKSEPDILAIFTAEQPSDLFKSNNVLLAFVADKSTSCVFAGGFINKGPISFSSFKKKYGASYEAFSNWFNQRRTTIDKNKNRVYYDIEPIDFLNQYRNRLLIDWGGDTRSWYQRKLNKAILAL